MVTDRKCAKCKCNLVPNDTLELSFRWWSGMTFCDECFEYVTTRQNLFLRFMELNSAGLLRDDFREADFGKSNPDIEAMNPDAWAKGRECSMDSNLFLYGSVGSGKTHLGRCVLKVAFVNGLSVAETNARRFTKIVDRFDEGGGILDKWMRARYLLIDDVDKADWNFSRLTALWELLDHRRAASNRTIMTSNLSPKEILSLFRACSTKGEISNASLADATLDRMKPVYDFEMKGKSQR